MTSMPPALPPYGLAFAPRRADPAPVMQPPRETPGNPKEFEVGPLPPARPAPGNPFEFELLAPATSPTASYANARSASSAMAENGVDIRR